MTELRRPTRRYSYVDSGPAIYVDSFATIRREADLSRVPADAEKVAVRMIHGSGQVDLTRDLVIPRAFAASFAVYDPQIDVLLDPRTAVAGRVHTQRFGSFPTLTPGLIDALLGATQNGDFLVAERGDLWFMQYADNGDTFALEYREGDESQHLAAVVHGVDQISAALHGWLTGDDAAYRDLTWEVLTF